MMTATMTTTAIKPAYEVPVKAIFSVRLSVHRGKGDTPASGPMSLPGRGTPACGLMSLLGEGRGRGRGRVRGYPSPMSLSGRGGK